MIYVTSDLHGYPCDKFTEFLYGSGFTDNDKLYVLGDMIDRGDDGVKIVQWMMKQLNVYPIFGNHEVMMLTCRFLFDEVTERSIDDLSADDLNSYIDWIRNGGEPTIKALRELSVNEREAIVDYLLNSSLYEEVEAGGRKFILVHGGLGNFSPDKGIDEYTLREIVWNRPTLDQRYYDDKTVIFGHTPTPYLQPGNIGRAIVTDTWIDIDTGASGGYAPMLLRLDDMKEFYIDQ